MSEPLPVCPGWRALLALAALDRLLTCGWMLLLPAGVFALLHLEPAPDALLLWRGLGVLTLGQGMCLVVAAVWPRSCGALAWVPLLGQLLEAGLWLWLLGSTRIQPAPAALALLLGHDVLGVLILAVFLARGGNPPASRLQ